MELPSSSFLAAARWLFLLWLSLCPTVARVELRRGPIPENERRREHLKRYDPRWPPKHYNPDNSPGWKALMDERFGQVAEIDDLGRRYEGYMQTVAMALIIPNFTEYGFGLVRAPQELADTLRDAIRTGYENGDARLEIPIEVIEGPQCLFIDRADLTKRVLDELQTYTETWAGMALTPTIAYGFRLYQNNSVLNMHVDRPQTHIISMIFHIDSSDDAEPWPIYIEDLRGRTHEVILSPGDILFYESAKCLHGRPKMFNGTWYSSIFVHYYPTDGWQDTDHHLEGHYAIPLRWNDNIPEEKKTHIPLKMVGTSFKEPSCPNEWCRTQDTIKWHGPAEDGMWIAADGTKHPFKPRRYGTDEL